MKNGCLLLFMIFVLKANAQIINFPDANFKAKLLQANVGFSAWHFPIMIDANNDGEIEVSEAADVVFLYIENANISDLTGINNFANLSVLRCKNNSLTNITINSPIRIMDLDASHNLLTSVNVNFGNFMSEYDPALNLSHNNLTSFSVSNAMFSGDFDLSNNNLSSLTINNCRLGNLYVGNNNLTSIEFSGLNTVYGLAVLRGNPFTSVDLRGIHIEELYLGDNVTLIQNYSGNIYYSSSTTTQFDLGNYRGIEMCQSDAIATGKLVISNCPNLVSINLKNGFNHTTVMCEDGDKMVENLALRLRISNCPNLNNICVDEAEKPYIQQLINNLGLQSQVQVTSDCAASAVLGSVQLSKETVVISPVPVKDFLQIQSNGNFEISSIEIYNNLGQLLQKETGDQQEINLSGFSKGSYYLKIKSGNSVLTKQFLKE